MYDVVCCLRFLSKVYFKLLEPLGIPLSVRFARNPPVVDVFRYFVFLLLCQAVRRGAGRNPVHCKRPYSRVSPLVSVLSPSRIVCRIELDPMFRVGMLDVAACVLSNPLTFLRGIQSLWIFLQIYSFLNTPPFRMALIALIQLPFTCG